MLWVATIFVTGFGLFPYYVYSVIPTLGKPTTTESTKSDNRSQDAVVMIIRTIRVYGMTCPACAAELEF